METALLAAPKKKVSFPTLSEVKEQVRLQYATPRNGYIVVKSLWDQFYRLNFYRKEPIEGCFIERNTLTKSLMVSTIFVNGRVCIKEVN